MICIYIDMLSSERITRLYTKQNKIEYIVITRLVLKATKMGVCALTHTYTQTDTEYWTLRRGTHTHNTTWVYLFLRSQMLLFCRHRRRCCCSFFLFPFLCDRVLTDQFRTKIYFSHSPDGIQFMHRKRVFGVDWISRTYARFENLNHRNVVCSNFIDSLAYQRNAR